MVVCVGEFSVYRLRDDDIKFLRIKKKTKYPEYGEELFVKVIRVRFDRERVSQVQRDHYLFEDLVR